jgi:carbon monoxide dehydrogenase subunit G
MAMHLSASYVFNAPVDRVWALLMDTDRVGGCLPGAKGLKPLGDDRYEAELAVAVAAISGDFKGTIALEDRNPPNSYRLVVEGSGRPGFVKGQALVTLVPGDGSTTVRIEADADVGGMIARVGQRLLEGVARMTMDRFYACLAKAAEKQS